jgi:hypothetical protein
MKNLNNAEWKRKQQKIPMFFDVRTDEEVAEDSENAINDIHSQEFMAFRKNG